MIRVGTFRGAPGFRLDGEGVSYFRNTDDCRQCTRTKEALGADPDLSLRCARSQYGQSKQRKNKQYAAAHSWAIGAPPMPLTPRPRASPRPREVGNKTALRNNQAALRTYEPAKLLLFGGYFFAQLTRDEGVVFRLCAEGGSDASPERERRELGEVRLIRRLRTERLVPAATHSVIDTGSEAPSNRAGFRMFLFSKR